MKYFFEIKLGRRTIGDYEKKFLGVLKYVGFIKHEKVKIQIFMSGLPSFYKDNIQYDEPRNITKTIIKSKYMYEKGKGRESFHKSWKDKKNEKSYHRRNVFKPHFNKNSPNTNKKDQPSKFESKREDSSRKRKTTNKIMGMQRTTHLQGFP
jgi:hypothetical protein